MILGVSYRFSGGTRQVSKGTPPLPVLQTQCNIEKTAPDQQVKSRVLLTSGFTICVPFVLYCIVSCLVYIVLYCLCPVYIALYCIASCFYCIVV